MSKYTFNIYYTTNNIKKHATSNNDDFCYEIVEHGNLIELKFEAKNTLTIQDVWLEFDYEFQNNSLFFANGYQSWTDTKEFAKNEKMPDLGFIGKSIFGKSMGLKYVGDYTFTTYTKKPNIFHSNGYTYIRNGDSYEFYGSLTDRNGYTIIYADMSKNKISIHKDVQGVEFFGQTTLMSLLHTSGTYEQIFDKYFDTMQIKPLTTQKIKGYTSWYNYYQNITQDCVLRDLESLTNVTKAINVFQIDDGFQNKVGEWLSVNKTKFPNGMKYIVDKIHSKTIKAGLWLAPFGVQKNSEMVKQHPSWFVKNECGKNFCVGANWGGFYALDIYNQEVRDYLKLVFHTVLREWGFDMVKLDFLYAASVLPRNNKSRGEIMYDAIDLLRECIGDDKQILGCGVQMMPCFGKVEYMRIGADMSLQWKHSFLRQLMHREDVSTKNAINNSMYRRHLNGRAFLCDPDVFLLRDYNIKFSFEQRKLLAKFIKLFGGVLFTSDDVGKYNEKQLEVMHDTFTDTNVVINQVNKQGSLCIIDYIENGENKQLQFDLDQ